MDFPALITARLDELGLNVNQAEARAGLPQGYIRGVLRTDDKRAIPSIEKAAVIADVLGLEFYLGPPRDVEPAPKDAPDMGGYAKIPLHDVELAAGPGLSNGSEDVVDRLAFRRSWLRKIGVSPRNARLAHVRGDSMEPILKDGDLVLIDVGRRSIPARPRKPGKPPRADLYAVLDGGEARVKRVEHSQVGRLILHSDNHALYPPEIREGANADDLGIIGKVVWWGHTVKE